MTSMPLDFAPRSVWSIVYRLPLWAWPLLLAGVLACAAAGWRLWTIREHVLQARQALEQAQQRTSARSARASGAQTGPQITSARAASVNAAIRQLNLPWDELLDALEGASSRRVALLELRPDPTTRRLLGVAEARGRDDMVVYMERLKAQPMFAGAVLTSHQVSEQDRNKPVRFEFAATWRELQP